MCSYPILCTAVYRSTDCQPPRDQLNRENENILAPLAPENLVSQDGLGRPVPRQPDYYPHTSCLRIAGPHQQAESHACYTNNRVSPEFIGSRNCVPIALTAESPPAQSQYRSRGSSSNGCHTFECHHGSIKAQLSFCACCLVYLLFRYAPRERIFVTALLHKHTVVEI